MIRRPSQHKQGVLLYRLDAPSELKPNTVLDDYWASLKLFSKYVALSDDQYETLRSQCCFMRLVYNQLPKWAWYDVIEHVAFVSFDCPTSFL